MIWIYDLLILLGVSIWLGTRVLFLGVAVFTLGLFFQFQARRTRLLIGGSVEKLPRGKKIKAAGLALVFTGFLVPLVNESGEGVSLHTGPEMGDWALPVVILIGLLTASLMVALGAEKRRR